MSADPLHVLSPIGRPIGTVYGLNQAAIGAILYPITPAEQSAGVTPTNYQYEAGDVRRYGADQSGVADSTTAIQNALDSNGPVYIPTGTYIVTSTLTLSNFQDIRGDGAKNSVLKYTPTTGRLINPMTGKVQSIRSLKLLADPGTSGWCIASDIDEYVTDLTIDEYEIEGFNGGIFIMFGLQVTIGKGRLIGKGTPGVFPTWNHVHEAGSIGIQLGDRTQTGAGGVQTVNVGNLAEAYVSSYETAVKMHGDIMSISDCVLEFCDVCIECASILNVSGNWLQAETYLFTTYAGGWEIGAYTNKYFDTAFNSVDDPAQMASLATSAEELSVIQKSEFKGAGLFRYRFATTASRGVQFGAATPVTVHSESGSLRVKATTRPLEVDRDATGAITLFGLYQQGTARGYLGVDSNAQPALLGSGGSNTAARWDNAANLITGGASLNTNATDGFLYLPTCAGTPTGTPTTKAGWAPAVIDTTNNKLYFYSGGAWRDAGP